VGAGGTTVGRYPPVRVAGDGAPGGATGGERVGLGDAVVAQGGLDPGRGVDGEGRVGGAAWDPHRIVPVRTSYTRPDGPWRNSSRNTFSVWGIVHERAAARPGTDVVPSDWRVAIACCRSSGAGRDQKGSRTERGGPAMGRKTIVRGEPEGKSRGQKWAPAKRLSVSWTVPPRDAFRRYPRPGYVRREGLYSYWTLRRVTTSRFRGLKGPYRGRTQPNRPVPSPFCLRLRNLQASAPASVRVRNVDPPGGATVATRSRRGRALMQTLREGRGFERRTESEHGRRLASW
jgi:hypothetical protein